MLGCHLDLEHNKEKDVFFILGASSCTLLGDHGRHRSSTNTTTTRPGGCWRTHYLIIWADRWPRAWADVVDYVLACKPYAHTNGLRKDLKALRDPLHIQLWQLTAASFTVDLLPYGECKIVVMVDLCAKTAQFFTSEYCLWPYSLPESSNHIFPCHGLPCYIITKQRSLFTDFGGDPEPPLRQTELFSSFHPPPHVQADRDNRILKQKSPGSQKVPPCFFPQQTLQRKAVLFYLHGRTCLCTQSPDTGSRLVVERREKDFHVC